MLPLRILGLLGLLAVPAFFIGLAFDLHALRVVVKPWPVLALAAAVWAHGRHPYARSIALGLAFSAAGDLLLELRETTFLLGVGAFLLAHLAYTAAFLGEARRPCFGWALLFAAWGGGVVWALGPGLRAAAMLTPVTVYTAVICAMMWRAAARLGDGTWSSRLAFGGAVLFAASDTLIAVDRFSDLAPPGVRWAIMILYWTGQAGLAASTRPESPP